MTTDQTASQAYAERREDIDRLLAILRSELDAHAGRAALADRHWGYPGDLGHIRDGLLELAAFVTGEARDTLEAGLATRPVPDPAPEPAPELPRQITCPACGRDIDIRPLPTP